MKRGVMNNVARTRAMRFEWQKLVTPLTSKAVVADWQAKNSEVTKRLAEARGASLTVEPIDWEYWKKEIKSEGAVEEMQKEYEAMTFPKMEAYTPEVRAKLDSIEADATLAEKEAVHASGEVKEADKVLETVQWFKKEALHWEYTQFQDFIPGLKEQHMEEFENEFYNPTEEMKKLDSVDWRAASADLKEGKRPDLGTPEDRLGDMSISEERALQEQGKWSIARVFASKDDRAKIQERVEKTFQ